MGNKWKYLLALLGILITKSVIWACPVCEQQQPKITQGLTHGAGPQSNWDWVIIIVISVITILTLIFSLKYLIRPGEKNGNHIKQSILNH